MKDLVEIFSTSGYVYMQKINIIQPFHQEIYVIQESCNLIG